MVALTELKSSYVNETKTAQEMITKLDQGISDSPELIEYLKS